MHKVAFDLGIGYLLAQECRPSSLGSNTSPTGVERIYMWRSS